MSIEVDGHRFGEMKASKPTAFHTAPSYFSLPPRTPSASSPGKVQPSSASRLADPAPSSSGHFNAPTEGSVGFADALAKQLHHAASSSSPPLHDPAYTPTSNQNARQPALTPRKRSPPSNGETPPHHKSDFFGSSSAGSSAATPYVSRLSLKPDPSTSTASLPDELSASKRLSPIPMGRPKSGSMPLHFQLSPPTGLRAAKPVASDRFHALLPAELLALLEANADRVLLLDLRAHSAFSLSEHGRLAGSVNLCVPSTLLRRPNFKIPKVADNVQDPDERLRVLRATADAHAGRLAHLVVIDHNSGLLTVDSPLHALLLKYEAEGFPGALHWAQGGFHALAKEPGYARFCETGPRAAASREPSPPTRQSSASSGAKSGSDASDLFSLGSSSSWSSSQSSLLSQPSYGSLKLSASPGSMTREPVLNARALPMAAFDGRSTQNYISGTGATSQHAASPTKVFTNPFFDSIRQNHEALSFERSMDNLAPVSYPFEAELRAQADRFPPFLRSLILLDPQQRAERLAREFYELEAMEQKRMQQVMEWHATVQGEGAAAYNPHSISAGVELGHLNRYKHIFPFEHTRCRIQRFVADQSDYINASHIAFGGQCTSKAYIATQGPVMPACGDFHQLLVQERVGVVLMLCNLREGGQEKCCKYWAEGAYGSMRVQRAREEVASPAQLDPASSAAGGFFSAQDLSRQSSSASSRASGDPFTQRTLLISSQHYPDRPPHRVRHIQYDAWPDFDIPPSVADVLDLIDLANKVNEEMAQANGLSALPPVLVHCSAGCGRTGCLMAIDVVSDLLKHQLRSQAHEQPADAMEVDMVSADCGASQGKSGQTLLDEAAAHKTPPLHRADPLFAVVNEMREQRMSMVANLAQYRFCHEAVLAAQLRNLA